jgi:DNA topoisomerase-2
MKYSRKNIKLKLFRYNDLIVYSNKIMNSNVNNNNDTLSHKYQQKTDKEHIIDNPDTYIGSIEKIDSNVWILKEESNMEVGNKPKIIEKNINYIPGLFKLFDEGIVNCRDHVIRMQQAIENNIPNSLPVTNIDISIDNDGTITMMNDGNGIDVAEHPEYKIWIPELIFGHLRTSTNYDKSEKKIVGGKNGFGFKLVLIWSTYGCIETVDHVRGLKYIQEFKNNLDEIGKPKISKCSKCKPYTKITFKPDYQRLGLTGLSPDLLSLLKKRVYDVAAVTDKNLKVKYNSVLVPIKNFQNYIDLYIGDKTDCPRVYEENGPRWEYAVALTLTNEFSQISFVNGIHTSKGGKHVEFILNQITRKLSDYIEKKKKVKVNPNSIKEQLILFLRCDIENPAFDSQTKDYMNTPPTKFGSKCEVSDKFIEKIAKMGVMDAALQITELKENKAAKKSDGTKSKNIRGIPKLTDANWAGTEKSNQCIIILCEGDSAKAGIISGLTSEDRNIIGVYPMKGKILNVRGENVKKIAENKEITEIKKILGLEIGKEYKTIADVQKHLRYSKILFMTDQDLDGSHIKGLGINLFQSEWPSLYEIPGFIGFMNTPILKAKKGNQEKVFYNEGEYNVWKETEDSKAWKIKYYKGLGTSTGKEFREYFMQKKMVGFEHNGKKSDDAIDMVFNKKRADDRKYWLENDYDRNSYLDTTKPMVAYEEFINKEFIHFSKYDCDRSIPNIMDGLKISLRKILFAAFKKNLNSEIKVAQFSGYVSENSCYHHGEASLNQAIKGMAQNFVGSNNINLLVPSGQFGTRLQGGNDSASERYIFTYLNKVTRLIYPIKDDAILDYLNDDGIPVEPIFYAPIIPMVLVNGTKGIGTGFSTEILCYNPKDIIDYLKEKLLKNKKNEPFQFNKEFLPFYQGFTGSIQKIEDSKEKDKDKEVIHKKFLIKGKYVKLATDKIRVTELPVGYWTDDFKEYLEKCIDPGNDKDGKKIIPLIKDYDDLSKDTTIDFIIYFVKGKLEELEQVKSDYGCNGIEKLLKLYSTSSTSNMHLFDEKDKLKKYDSVEKIIDDYFIVRLDLFQKRKDYEILELEKDLALLSNKTKFIQENLDGTIDLRKKKREEIIKILELKGYPILEQDLEYKYLVKMPMDSVTEEHVEKMNKDCLYKKMELEEIKNTSIYDRWLNELELLSKALK